MTFLFYKAKQEAYSLRSRIFNTQRLSKLDENVKVIKETTSSRLLLRRTKLAKLYLPTLHLEKVIPSQPSYTYKVPFKLFLHNKMFQISNTATLGFKIQTINVQESTKVQSFQFRFSEIWFRF